MPESDPRWETDDPRNDKIYMGILVSLMATVFAGAIIALLGDMVLESPAMKQGGFYVAIIAGVLYFAFRFWGRAKAAKYQRDKVRRQLAEDPARDDSEGS